jgi:hypothetical protein
MANLGMYFFQKNSRWKFPVEISGKIRKSMEKLEKYGNI